MLFITQYESDKISGALTAPDSEETAPIADEPREAEPVTADAID